jgi:PAS domain S-box-containing protein
MYFKNNHKYFLAAIVESSQDSIVTIDFDLVITSWNKAAENVYGYTSEEAVGRPLTMLTLPEDLVMLMTNVDLIRHGKVVKVFETERVHKDNSRMLLEVVLSPVKNEDGDIIGVSTIARDLTKFREAENAIREGKVLTRLIEAQEEERRRIARDLHDELGQHVTSLRFKLRNARESCTDDATCTQIDEMELIAQEIDNSVDFIAWELRPAPLEGVPLPEAINSYLRQWSKHNGINAEFHSTGMKGTRLSDKVEIALYRIVQESLNNTHKHARADNVQLVCEKRGDTVVLIIEDDGSGFDQTNGDQSGQGMGLTGIRERASLVGGTVEIESSPGQGTTVFVRVPAEPAAADIDTGRKTTRV